MKCLKNTIRWLEIIILLLLVLCLASLIVLIVAVYRHCTDILNPVLTAVSSCLIGTISCAITIFALSFEIQKKNETQGIIDSRFIDLKDKYECGIRIKNVGISSPAQIIKISIGKMDNGNFVETWPIYESDLRERLSKITNYPTKCIYSSTFLNRYLGSGEHIWLFKLEINKTKKISKPTIQKYEKANEKLINFLSNKETSYLYIRYKSHIGDKDYKEFINKIIIIEK